MELDRRDARTVDEAVKALRRACEKRLLAVALTGEAASAGYRPGKSPLSLVVVVDDVEPAILDAIRTASRRPLGRSIATPLVLDPLYLETSKDVFPLEFLDLLDRHRLLDGRIDPFADLTIARGHLRVELEEQLRGKMLHLWEMYLETPRTHSLVRALIETLPHFYIVLRGMLFLREEDRPTAPRDLLGALEAAYGVRLQGFRDLEAMRTGAPGGTSSERRALFGRYLEEVRTLVRLIDAA